MLLAAEKCPLKTLKGDDFSFFRGVEFMLKTHYEAQLSKGERFFAAKCYKEAVALYKEVLVAITDGYFPKALPGSFVETKIRCRLAESYYYQACYDDAVALVASGDPPNMLYLAAMAFKEKKEYERAVDYFQAYLDSGDPSALLHYAHAAFELGFFSYQGGNYAKAKRFFEVLKNVKGKEKPYLLGSLYLARIALKEGRAKEAEGLLAELEAKIDKHDPLKYEVAYLRGEAACCAGEFAEAVDFFSLSLPPAHITSGEWVVHAHFRLGMCWMKLGDDPLKADAARQEFFSKGEKVFLSLLSCQLAPEMKESVLLAMGRLYLLKEDAARVSPLFSRRIVPFFP